MENMERVNVHQNKDNFSWFVNNYGCEGYEQLKNDAVLKYFKTENNANEKQNLNNQISELDEQIIKLIRQKILLNEEIEFIDQAENVKGKNKEISEYINKLEKENKLNNWYTVNNSWITKNVIENGTYKLILWYKNEADESWRTGKKTYEIGYTFSFNDILSDKIIKDVSKKVNTKEEAEKYLEGRKKVYENYFKEEKPVITEGYDFLISKYGIRLEGYKLELEVK